VLRVFACSQWARIFSAKKTQKLGLFYSYAIRGEFSLARNGLTFFLRKKRKTRVFYQRTLLEHATTCRARIFSSKKT
jgi:hypothetical protein